MRILIGAIGKPKSGPERELAEDYVVRAGKLGRRAGISSIAIVEQAESGAATADLRRAEEAERLTRALPDGATLVCLDETGKDLTSSDLATLIRRHADAGTADLAFLIGGPDGHGDPVKARAELMVRFGRATWPHRLVRAMLAEQIYRSVTILLNHPYHRA